MGPKNPSVSVSVNKLLFIKTIKIFPCSQGGLWLISIAGLGFGFGHRFLYYADTMGKGSESESESVETCSAKYYVAIGFGIQI